MAKRVVGERRMCPLSEKPTGAFPGKDRCPRCGRVVYIRNDGTVARHNVPTTLRGA